MRRETQISTAIIEEFLLLPYSFRVTLLVYASQTHWGVTLHKHYTCYDLFSETAFKMPVKGSHQIPWEKLEPSGFFSLILPHFRS